MHMKLCSVFILLIQRVSFQEKMKEPIILSICREQRLGLRHSSTSPSAPCLRLVIYEVGKVIHNPAPRLAEHREILELASVH